MAEGTTLESLEAAGYVEFAAAGQRAVGDYHCSECGYGIAVQQRLPVCPMCSGESWEPVVGSGLRLQ